MERSDMVTRMRCHRLIKVIDTRHLKRFETLLPHYISSSPSLNFVRYSIQNSSLPSKASPAYK